MIGLYPLAFALFALAQLATLFALRRRALDLDLARRNMVALVKLADDDRRDLNDYRRRYSETSASLRVVLDELAISKAAERHATRVVVEKERMVADLQQSLGQQGADLSQLRQDLSDAREMLRDALEPGTGGDLAKMPRAPGVVVPDWYRRPKLSPDYDPRRSESFEYSCSFSEAACPLCGHEEET